MAPFFGMAKLPKLTVTAAFKACVNGETHPREFDAGTYQIVPNGAPVGENELTERVAEIAEEMGACKPRKKPRGSTGGGANGSASQPTAPASGAKTSTTPNPPDAK